MRIAGTLRIAGGSAVTPVRRSILVHARLRRARPLKGDGAALADVLDDRGAEDGEALAFRIAGGGIDQAVTAFGKNGGGERLAGGVGDSGIGER